MEEAIWSRFLSMETGRCSQFFAACTNLAPVLIVLIRRGKSGLEVSTLGIGAGCKEPGSLPAAPLAPPRKTCLCLMYCSVRRRVVGEKGMSVSRGIVWAGGCVCVWCSVVCVCVGRVEVMLGAGAGRGGNSLKLSVSTLLLLLVVLTKASVIVLVAEVRDRTDPTVGCG